MNRTDEIRLQELVKVVSKVYPYEKVTGSFKIKNAKLQAIATSPAASQRIFNWANQKIRNSEVNINSNINKENDSMLVKPKKAFDQQKMIKATEMFLDALGSDWQQDENTKDTPTRVAKMYEILLGGNDISNEEHIKVFQSGTTDMVTLANIPFYSFCAHHLLPFIGKLHIAYIPNGKVLGVSKLVRLARTHAKKLQLQERLTNDIAEDIQNLLKPQGVAVQVQSSHFCMVLRGVRSHGSYMTTTSLKGLLKQDASARAEFLEAIKSGGQIYGY